MSSSTKSVQIIRTNTMNKSTAPIKIPKQRPHVALFENKCMYLYLYSKTCCLISIKRQSIYRYQNNRTAVYLFHSVQKTNHNTYKKISWRSLVKEPQSSDRQASSGSSLCIVMQAVESGVGDPMGNPRR